MADSETERLYILSSLSNSLQVLESFLDGQCEWGVTELADHLGMNKSTCHRMLVTLKTVGAVEQTESQKYRLGPLWLPMGTLYSSQVDLVKVAAPIMQRFAAFLGLIVHLAVLKRGKVYDVARANPPFPVKVEVHPRFGRSATSTAPGKVFLSRLSEPELEDFLEVYGLQSSTCRSIDSVDLLKWELRKVATQGYAMDDREFADRIHCVAAPVYDDQNRMVGALSVSGPARGLSRKRLSFLAGRVQAVANKISWELGWLSLSGR